MIGTNLYQKKSRLYTFLILYAALAVAGLVIAGLAVRQGQRVSGAAGFMAVFGAGMFFLTLSKGFRPQVTVREDFLEVRQSRTIEYIRYRNIATVSRPDMNRIVITLKEEGRKKDMTIWLRELEKADVDRLFDFLVNKGWNTHQPQGSKP